MNRDASIIAQNSGGHAANIYGSIIAVRGDDGFDPDLYKDIVSTVFSTALELAGSDVVLEKFDNADQAPAPTSGGGGGGQRGGGGGGGSDSGAGVTLNFGKHRGKTIAQAYSEDPEWIQWAAENSNNNFIRGKISEYLASLG